MRATRFNHVSIHAVDMEASLRFYTEVFGMERIPSPTFRHHVEWLRLGDQQLHLFLRETPAPPFHHIALDVDDFEAAYLKAKELSALEGSAWDATVRELPDGAVQMYLRDPAGNLVEIDWPDVTTLSPELQARLHHLEWDHPQEGDAAVARLYLDERARRLVKR